MILLLDVGNTSIKWAQMLEGRLTPQQILVHRGVEPQTWTKQLFRERFRPSQLFVANVAGSDMQQRIAEEAERLWQVTARFATTARFAAGVTHAYRDVSAHGVDRWLALIAGYRLAGAAACVIDVGTAVTVDGVDGKGLHLGGLILPGLRSMIDSLLENTSDIARQARKLSGAGGPDVAGSASLLAAGTAQAVANGALLGIAAAADRAVDEVARRVGTAPRVFITGGDAGQIVRVMQTPAEPIPDLVLQGLAILTQ